MSAVDPRRPEVSSFAIDATATMVGIRKAVAPIESYDDRNGYDEDFLGQSARVPLPTVPAARKKDVVKVKPGNGSVLDYRNFSVVMSRSRRICFFSASNIDGKTRRKRKRGDNPWRFDGRLDTKLQILEECYGSNQDGLFSRGHMTRREDPVWGKKARQAEDDTFHVTNAVPQMQGHNGGIWLSLEDHVLQNADKDDQRVSVFTGPVLRRSDPVLYKVKIPVQFWKIVAFLQPRTKTLSAVAYLDSQAEFLPEAGRNAFVWGQFRGLQVPVSRIENLSGLRLAALKRADVLAGADGTFAYSVSRVEDILLS